MQPRSNGVRGRTIKRQQYIRHARALNQWLEKDLGLMPL